MSQRAKYTAFPSQVFQVFELPVETEKLETHQLLLLTKRELFLHAVFNSSHSPQENVTLYKEVSAGGARRREGLTFNLSFKIITSLNLDMIDREEKYFLKHLSFFPLNLSCCTKQTNNNKFWRKYFLFCPFSFQTVEVNFESVSTTFLVWGSALELRQFVLQEMSDALTEYEEVCRDAQDAGVNIVTKDFTNNWDYIQSCFFALTILTTIGDKQSIPVVLTNLFVTNSQDTGTLPPSLLKDDSSA